jgi:hypothetical protein
MSDVHKVMVRKNRATICPHRTTILFSLTRRLAQFDIIERLPL